MLHLIYPFTSWIDIWIVSAFWRLWTMLLWTFIYVSLCEDMFSFLLGSLPKSGIPGSYGKCMFNFTRNSKTIFQSGTFWYAHQQCMRVPVLPHPYQHLERITVRDNFLNKWSCLSPPQSPHKARQAASASLSESGTQTKAHPLVSAALCPLRLLPIPGSLGPKRREESCSDNTIAELRGGNTVG